MINLYRLIQNTNNPICILYQMIQIADTLITQDFATEEKAT